MPVPNRRAILQSSCDFNSERQISGIPYNIVLTDRIGYGVDMYIAFFTHFALHSFNFLFKGLVEFIGGVKNFNISKENLLTNYLNSII